MKYRAEVYYRFKARRDGAQRAGVRLGMEIEADDEDGALEKAKASCIGSQWPSRVWVATDVRPSAEETP